MGGQRSMPARGSVRVRHHLVDAHLIGDASAIEHGLQSGARVGAGRQELEAGASRSLSNRNAGMRVQNRSIKTGSRPVAALISAVRSVAPREGHVGGRYSTIVSHAREISVGIDSPRASTDRMSYVTGASGCRRNSFACSSTPSATFGSGSSFSSSRRNWAW